MPKRCQEMNTLDLCFAFGHSLGTSSGSGDQLSSDRKNSSCKSPTNHGAFVCEMEKLRKTDLDPS